MIVIEVHGGFSQFYFVWVRAKCPTVRSKLKEDERNALSARSDAKSTAA